MNLESKLRKLREKHNWSQMEVAHQLDISQSAYNKWETGQSKPKLQNLKKIAEIFQVNILDFIQFHEINDNKNSQEIIIENNDFLEKLLANQEIMYKLTVEQNILINNILEQKHK